MTSVQGHTPGEQKILVTVSVEDYFHVGAFRGLIAPGSWGRFERRLAESTQRTLDFLAEHDARATFFVMGWVADHLPEVVSNIVAAGHEVASQGYEHDTIAQFSPERFREDLIRCRFALERAGGRQVLGHRVPHFIGPKDLWALDVLAEEGYAYDASLRPMLWSFGTEPWRRRIHVHEHHGKTLRVVPVSSWAPAGLSLPIAGGGYFRQLPESVVRHAVEHWFEHEPDPLVLYFHTWELDPDQPRISASRLRRIRQYRNLERMPRMLDEIFKGRTCVSIAEHLELKQKVVDRTQAAPPSVRDRVVELRPRAARVPVTIVVPVYNESASLKYLGNTLGDVERALSRTYDLKFIFVDDGSSDDTVAQLGALFGGKRNCRVIEHVQNRGVAAAILTGIRAAETEIVCSIDADCTYDPLELRNMIPLLTDGVDLVTGSPYHPKGEVVNVPAWRLGLSRGASWLYRRALSEDLYTFTSCFRVYRRSKVAPLPIQEDGFLGVAEILARLVLNGSKIAEYPAALHVRVLGHSKMKTARAIKGHLRLLARLALERRNLVEPPPAPDLPPEESLPRAAGQP